LDERGIGVKAGGEVGRTSAVEKFDLLCENRRVETSTYLIVYLLTEETEEQGAEEEGSPLHNKERHKESEEERESTYDESKGLGP
jgi:hypothetical protein